MDCKLARLPVFAMTKKRLRQRYWDRCRQLMAIWPSLQWLKCFSQPWEGDVTFVLPSSFMQIKKSITNPTSQDLLEACQQVSFPRCSSNPLVEGASIGGNSAGCQPVNS